MTNEERKQNTESQSTSSTTSKVTERLGDVSQQVAQVAHDVQEKGSALLHDAGDKVARTYREAQAETSELLHDLDERARYAGQRTVRYARRVGVNSTDFVRANALPLAVVGAGLGWLAWNVVEDRRRRTLGASVPSEATAPRLGQGSLGREARISRAVPPPPPAAASTTSGAKLMGVRTSDSSSSYSG